MNFDLSETGYLQAEQLSKRFDDIHLDGIYCSDLRRAMNTAVPVAERKGIQITPDKRLRERYMGVQEGRLPSRIPQEQFDSMKVNPHARFGPDGESFIEHKERVAEFLEELRENESHESSILLVAHGGTLHAILYHLMDVPYEEIKDKSQWGTDNTCVYIVEHRAGENPSVQLRNCTKHLE
jgi:broad specificity phosphatase PhoE